MSLFLELELEIRDRSRTPKYKQIVSEINNKIEKGLLAFGEKLPSINHLSEGYQLSRNTVEKAYIQLKQDGIVDAVKGKGYFVKNTQPISKVKVMLLFNKLSDYKRVIYNTIVSELQETADVDLFVYNADFNLFHKLLNEHREDYHYYMIMPHFKDENKESVSNILNTLPKDKLVLLDRKLEYFDNYFGNVYQDFKMDIYDTLYENLELMKKYNHLTLSFPTKISFPYPVGIRDGFRRFCAFNGFEHEVIEDITEDFQPKKGQGVITIADTDLINLIKNAKKADLKIGKDFGVISYNDTPLKEVLENGITVITTDFAEMGSTAANMVLNKTGIDVRNRFKLINRASY